MHVRSHEGCTTISKPQGHSLTFNQKLSVSSSALHCLTVQGLNKFTATDEYTHHSVR